MKIRFTKQAGIYAPGTVLDIGSGLADAYISQGVAVEMGKGEPETASISPGEHGQVRRGRPKKVR